jgi:hypothetical protein
MEVRMLSLDRILIDGTLLSLALGVLIFSSLIYNPRVWLQDYPVEVRAQVPPNTRQEKRLQIALMVPFFLLMLGVPYLSGLQLKAANGGSLPFLTAYLHSFFVLNIFNLFDAVVIDALVLTIMKPNFAVIPSTEGLDYTKYLTWGSQVKNYFKGIIFCAIFSLLIAAVMML